MRIASANRHGFSLIELLCVMVLLSVLGVVFGLLIKQTFDVERVQAQSFDRLLQNKVLADQFRADVARAEKAPATWQHLQADRHTLILQMKDDEHVAYVWHKGKLSRESGENGKLVERPLPIDASRVTVEFGQADLNLLRLRLVSLRDGKAVAGQTLEITAALGGDWR